MNRNKTKRVEKGVKLWTEKQIEKGINKVWTKGIKKKRRGQWLWLSW